MEGSLGSSGFLVARLRGVLGLVTRPVAVVVRSIGSAGVMPAGSLVGAIFWVWSVVWDGAWVLAGFGWKGGRGDRRDGCACLEESLFERGDWLVGVDDGSRVMKM